MSLSAFCLNNSNCILSKLTQCKPATLQLQGEISPLFFFLIVTYLIKAIEVRSLSLLICFDSFCLTPIFYSFPMGLGYKRQLEQCHYDGVVQNNMQLSNSLMRTTEGSEIIRGLLQFNTESMRVPNKLDFREEARTLNFSSKPFSQNPLYNYILCVTFSPGDYHATSIQK